MNHFQFPKMPNAISVVSAFSDNYIWLIESEAGTIIVDPGDATPVIDWLENNGHSIAAILITHHHNDHTGGVTALVKWQKTRHQTSCPVYGPKDSPFTQQTISVKANDTFNIGEFKFDVIETPGHTLDHICYLTKSNPSPWLFCGDTLFSGGCGRLFEGSAAQLYSALESLKSLPNETLVFCAHEYTLANLTFALDLLPDDEVIQCAFMQTKARRAAGQITLPSTIETERQINLFLRTDDKTLHSALTKHLTIMDTSTLNVFTALRALKDRQ